MTLKSVILPITCAEPCETLNIPSQQTNKVMSDVLWANELSAT